jgi:hypothetical protein
MAVVKTLQVISFNLFSIFLPGEYLDIVVIVIILTVPIQP